MVQPEMFWNGHALLVFQLKYEYISNISAHGFLLLIACHDNLPYFSYVFTILLIYPFWTALLFDDYCDPCV